MINRAIFFEQCAVMPIFNFSDFVGLIIYINQDDHIIIMQYFGNIRVSLEKTVQPVTPSTIVRAKHKEDMLMFCCSHGQRLGNLLRAVGSLIIKARTLYAGARG